MFVTAQCMSGSLSIDAGMAGGANSTAAEALRVIRAAKLHRHGPAAHSSAPGPVLQIRWADKNMLSLVSCKHHMLNYMYMCNCFTTSSIVFAGDFLST